MEYCKHCSKPILSDLKNQIYCSSECWRESKSNTKVEINELEVEEKSAFYVWSSIFSMLFGLFLLLILFVTFIKNEEAFLPLFTISAGMLALITIQNIFPKEEIKKLLNRVSGHAVAVGPRPHASPIRCATICQAISFPIIFEMSDADALPSHQPSCFI